MIKGPSIYTIECHYYIQVLVSSDSNHYCAMQESWTFRLEMCKKILVPYDFVHLNCLATIERGWRALLLKFDGWWLVIKACLNI